MDQTPDGSFASLKTQRRLQRIENFSTELIINLGLERYREEVVDKFYKINRSGVPDSIERTISVVIRDTFNEDTLQLKLRELEPLFGEHLTSGRAELYTQIKKKIQIMLLFSEYIKENRYDINALGEFFNKEGQFDWVSLFNRLKDYLSIINQESSTTLLASDIAYLFDHEISITEFKEKIQYLLQGNIVIPLSLKFDSMNFEDEPRSIYNEAKNFEVRGFTTSIVHPDISSNFLVSIPPRSNELLTRYFNLKLNFFRINEDRGTKDSLFKKFISELLEFHTKGISLGAIFDRTTLSFTDIYNQAPDNAIFRFHDLSKIAYVNENTAQFHINMLHDIDDTLRTIKSIAEVNLLSHDERYEAWKVIEWYRNRLIQHFGELGMKALDSYKLYPGDGKNFSQKLDELANIFKSEI